MTANVAFDKMCWSQKSKLEKRAEHLAEKYDLSLQLTTIWVKENPYKSQRPMLPSEVKQLKAWAKTV